jgi:hypothetical protein
VYMGYNRALVAVHPPHLPQYSCNHCPTTSFRAYPRFSLCAAQRPGVLRRACRFYFLTAEIVGNSGTASTEVKK